MEVIRDFPRHKKYKHSIITIGFYDGVHQGHQRIIREVVNQARIRGIKSCVITFDPHPSELFSHKPFLLLTNLEEKEEVLEGLGVDLMIIFSFTHQFASLSPSSFIGKLREYLMMEGIIIGEDFVFGRGREGNAHWLKLQEAKFGYKLKVMPLLRAGGEKVSSSLIRHWLKEGEIRKVTQWLSRPLTISGRVVKGKGRGHLIGFPTANLMPYPRKLLPCSGVYAGRVILGGRLYNGIINVGDRPTFKDSSSGVEVHILGFKGDIYEEQVKIELMERIREIRKFPSPASLARRLKVDKERAQMILGAPREGN